MPPLPIKGILGPTGRKAVAALYLPGAVAAIGTQVSGGALASTYTSVGTSSTLYLPLTEASTCEYSGTGTIGGTVLPDITGANGPVTVEVRFVNPATDITAYANLAAAFGGAMAYWAGLGGGYTAANAYAYTEGPAGAQTGVGSFLRSGSWAFLASTDTTAIAVQTTLTTATSINTSVGRIETDVLQIEAVLFSTVTVADFGCTFSVGGTYVSDGQLDGITFYQGEGITPPNYIWFCQTLQKWVINDPQTPPVPGGSPTSGHSYVAVNTNKITGQYNPFGPGLAGFASAAPVTNDSPDSQVADLNIGNIANGSTGVNISTGATSAIAAAIWSVQTSVLTVAGSIGKALASLATGTLNVIVSFANAAAALGVPNPSKGALTLTTFYNWNQGLIVGVDLSAATQIILTVKEPTNYQTIPDSAALIQIKLVGGLVTLNQSPYANTSDGSITYSSANGGTLLFAMPTQATALLNSILSSNSMACVYDVKATVGGVESPVSLNQFTIRAGVTQTT